MKILHERAELNAFFQEDVGLYIYNIGDLDDFFWNKTIWYGLREAGTLTAVALLYTAITPPPFLALTNNLEPMKQLVTELLPLLPDSFYTHLTPGLEPLLAEKYEMEPYGRHLKMSLTQPEQLEGIDTSGAVLLSLDDAKEVDAFYAASYPDSAYVSDMLDIGFYYGLRVGGELVSVAGVHVYSPTYRVAALGNITTHPDHRGKGYAKKTIVQLCHALALTTDHIGLNVKADNETAVALYKRLGFTECAQYDEFDLHKKRK